MRKPLLVFASFMFAIMLIVLLTTATSAADGLHGSFDEIVLWEGTVAGQGNLLYTIDLDQERRSPPIHRVYEGVNTSWYPPAYTFNDTHFFKGIDRAHPLFTISDNGKRIYDGPYVHGRPLYTFERIGRTIRVFKGPVSGGDVLYTFTEYRVYRGPNTQGNIILTTDSNLLVQRARVIQVIVLLLEMKPRLEGPDSLSTQASLHMEGMIQ